ncbi:MAG TPA: ribosome biogenesis factor YjgA [Usitatibacter sp.]|nr:ribosome biogenesis factor YjgA [Usitatibacter sp.]
MEDDDFISKTRRKRQMSELQDVGEALVKLSAEQLARLEMPESLRDAVLECKRFTKHEAVRRQMQYIGRLMRKIDAGPIAEQLARIEAPSQRHTALFHVAEKWRTEIISDLDAIERFVKEFPEADAERLRKLAATVREERLTSRPPRQFRELFHVLNAIVQDHERKHP